MIIAGHGRVEAAKILGLDKGATIRVDHLSGAQKRAYCVADNKLALNAGWDPEISRSSFNICRRSTWISTLRLRAFETAEIDIFVDGPKKTSKDPDE